MKNLGRLDRIIRLVLGLALIGGAVALQVSMGNYWWIGLLGIILLGTSAISTCPLYMPFRLSTKEKE